MSNGESSSPETSTADESTTSEPVVDEAVLQWVLLDMMDEDQREGTEGFMGSGDEARTDRLGAIIAGHGWPTGQLVGTDGATGAWLIAQHADHDVAFQQRASCPRS